MSESSCFNTLYKSMIYVTMLCLNIVSQCVCFSGELHIVRVKTSKRTAKYHMVLKEDFVAVITFREFELTVINVCFQRSVLLLLVAT